MGASCKFPSNAKGRIMNSRFRLEPATGILSWGLAVNARTDEYFTGLMERVVDGLQANSWAPDITTAMNLRGQTVDMIVNPPCRFTPRFIFLHAAMRCSWKVPGPAGSIFAPAIRNA